MSIEGDMQIKMKNSLDNIQKYIKEHNGCTLLLSLPMSSLKAAMEAGVSMFEISDHPRSRVGNISSRSPLEEIARDLKIARSIVGDNVHLSIHGCGTYTTSTPILFTENCALTLSAASANSVHVHKWNLKDIESIVKIAHQYGLLVEAFITNSREKYYYYGVNADTPDEVAKATKEMEKIGVDVIGLTTGMSYVGLNAGEIKTDIRKRIDALVSAASSPTIVEGGITLDNFKDIKETGVNIMVIGTAFREMLNKTITGAVKTILG